MARVTGAGELSKQRANGSPHAHDAYPPLDLQSTANHPLAIVLEHRATD
jgi:hypothetical protein